MFKPISAGSNPTSQMCTHSPPLEHHCGLMEYLMVHPNVVEEFVLNNVSQKQIEKWLIRKSVSKEGNSSQYSSNLDDVEGVDDLTSLNNSLSNWKFCVHSDKRKVLEKLTKEISLNFSDSVSVLNELIEMIACAIHSSRHTCYVVDGAGLDLYCYSDSQTSSLSLKKQEISSSNTVAGYVARAKESVFVPEILGDDRFPAGTGRDGMDFSVIAYPILLPNGSLYGLGEFVRDANAKPFEEDDMEIVASYMSWGTLAVQYADVANQVSSHTAIEKFIYEFGNHIMEQNTSVGDLLTFVMEFGKDAMQFDHYIIYMLDENQKEFHATVSNVIIEKDDGSTGNIEIKFPMGEGIAGLALTKNGVVNVKDPYSHENFCREIDTKMKTTTKSILATPVGTKGGTRGVIEVFNKKKGVFTDRDIDIMKLCATYCSLILSFQDFTADSLEAEKEICVIRDTLTWNIKPTKAMIKEIDEPDIGKDQYLDLYSLSFNMYENPHHFGFLFMKMAKTMFKKCGVNFSNEVLLNFTTTVRGLYHDMPYHNWSHAFSVAQFVACLLESLWDNFEPLERIGMFIAAICHDVDHRGLNNAFLLNTKHPLGNLYANGSVMECHHVYMTELVLENQETDIFFCLEREDKLKVKAYIKKMILSTDLFTHFERKDQMQTLINEKSFDWRDKDHRDLASMIMMTTSDLCGSVKPGEVHQMSSRKVFEEFYAQGDLEKKMGFQPLPMFTRREDFPLNQIGFLNGIVKPMIDMMSSVIPLLEELHPIIADNISHWEEIIGRAEADNITDETKKKIAELRIPHSEMQRKSLSFVMYNCSGKQTRNMRNMFKRRTSSVQKF